MNKMIKRILAFLAIIFWFILGIYVGVSGLLHEENQRQIDTIEQSESEEKIEYDGITFNSKETLERYIDEIKIDNFFGWINNVPELLILVLTSCALGAFGGLIRIISQVAFNNVNIEDTKFLTIPFLGLLLGMVVLGISHLLPAMLISDSDVQIRQTTLMFFSLFAGLFSESFLNWLENKFKTYLKSKSNLMK